MNAGTIASKAASGSTSRSTAPVAPPRSEGSVKRTQVIALTHDPHVIALAQAAVDPNLHTIHELP